ncbi:MAG: hypothetical protein GOP50_04730 [Candidatus Heimdallarchaeota archaeon]|nr:hypothetical protein [Candidatus Heimdallarchaeota archaeon]
MKKKEIITSGVLILLFSLTFVTPANAETTWGFEIDKNYVYELNKLTIFGTPLQFEFKDEARLRIVFNDFNDTGYSYNVYNDTHLLDETSTVFLSTEVENETLVLPQGLPIALPLTLGDIPDYLAYFGAIIDQTGSMIILDDIMENITDYMDVTYLNVYSVYDANYLSAKLDLFAPTVNASVLTDLLGDMDSGDIPISIPTNITEFKLNATLAFDATTGLFDHLIITLRSLSTDEYNYVDDFNADIEYELYKPTEPEPTTTVSYAWVVPIAVAVIFASSLFTRKRK